MNMLRNDPAAFEELVAEAKANNPELYEQLMEIMNTTELSNVESDILKNDQMRNRTNYLANLKKNNPEIADSVFRVMEQDDPEQYAAIMAILEDDGGVL